MTLQPGEQLDGYRIESLVATSGMASIYRATDTNTGNTVALKVPHPEVEREPQLFDRFRREQEIGTTLNHPGVMKVIKGAPPGRVYMAMEWVEGRLLRHLLAEGKLPVERAIRIAIGEHHDR